jgi:plasmid replication initiation protein
MITDLTKRNYTRQSHLIVDAKYALTRGEIDIILTLLTAITKEDKDFKDYEFTLPEFNSKTNKSMTNTDLKKIVKSLMSKPLEIEISKNNWEIFHWFSYFRFKDGLITCRFDKALKPYLIEIIGTRALADFRHLLPMRSSYSKRMYLLLKLHDKKGIRTFNVEELQETLKVPKSKKENYDKFKSGVLKKAEADINKFTDLEVSFTEKKRGKKVMEVTFTIKKNNADLKAFIANIRELYINQPLYKNKEERILQCSDKGLLYYADSPLEWLDKKTAMKAWEWLHENKKKLLCFENLFDEEEVMKKLKGEK